MRDIREIGCLLRYQTLRKNLVLIFQGKIKITIAGTKKMAKQIMTKQMEIHPMNLMEINQPIMKILKATMKIFSNHIQFNPLIIIKMNYLQHLQL